MSPDRDGARPRGPARQATRKAPATGARKPARPEPEGFAPAQFETPRAAPATRPKPRPAPASSRLGSVPAPPAILTDLLRGPLQMVGQMTGIETAARAMERLAASAERAAELIDRLDQEVGIERVISVLERLERLSETADQMNRSLRAMEKLALDVQKRVIEPLDRLPIPRALRGIGGSQKSKP